MPQIARQQRTLRLLAALICAALLFSSCSPAPTESIQPTSASPTAIPIPYAQVTFQVEVPLQTPASDSITLDVLDEVTGLAINPTRYTLKKTDDTHAAITIAIPVGSLVRYRYGRDSKSAAVEHTFQGTQVRYRLLIVAGTTSVNDIVCAWNDLPAQGSTGQVVGSVIDAEDQSPIPGVMVNVAGQQVVTGTDGSFVIADIPVGTHNLVAMSLDGRYSAYQQQAVIAENATTPVPLQLNAAKMVNVTFNVKSPEGEIQGLPIRIVGNSYLLGNTFADLNGGFSIVASRAPLLTLQSGTNYSLTLSLPAGYDLRYKYSLGDGFWNSERSSDGQLKLRQLIIPDHDITIDDWIDTWQVAGSAPVTFSVKVPETTAASDTVSLQFNPFAWTEPMPMWPIGNNEWMYILYNPMDLLGDIQYRYCRNDQCGVADDSATPGNAASGTTFKASSQPQTFTDTVSSWYLTNITTGPTVVGSDEVLQRNENFIAGVELTDIYNPSWQPYLANGYQNIKDIGANWIILRPSSSVISVNPPVMAAVPGKNPQWADLLQQVNWAAQKGLTIAVYPTFGMDMADTWISAPRDADWWARWFEQYTAALVESADLAALSNSGMLIIGGPEISPALPNGILSDGSPANVPANVTVYWEKLISTIRSHYSGQIYWAVGSDQLEALPDFVEDLDGLYLLTSFPLTMDGVTHTETIRGTFDAFLAGTVFPVFDQYQKPIVLALAYGAFNGAASGCISEEKCFPVDYSEAIATPTNELLQNQAVIYDTILASINQVDWVAGVVARGYYTPAALQDQSVNIHGKPAADVLWHWYTGFLTQ